MKKGTLGKRMILSVCLLVVVSFSASAQVTLLGKDPRDKHLQSFWTGANPNGSNLLVWVSQNAGGARWSNNVLPSLVYGQSYSNVTFAGTNYCTNWFRQLSWDATAATFQTYTLNWTNSVADASTVARFGDLTNVISGMITSGVSGATVATNFNPNQFIATPQVVTFKGAALVTNLQLRGLAYNVLYRTNTYTLTTNDDIVQCDAAQMLTGMSMLLMASASVPGQAFYFIKVDSTTNWVTVIPNGGEHIQGASSVVLSNQWQGIEVVSDRTNWFIHGRQ